MSRKPAKTQHSSTKKPTRNNAPTAARQASSTVADLQEQVSALTRELAEAREQQTATVDILKVISSSAFDLKVVFETVAESSVKLCGANRAFIYRFDGELLHVAAAAFPTAIILRSRTDRLRSARARGWPLPHREAGFGRRHWSVRARGRLTTRPRRRSRG